jgi:hypothetical protein
MLAIGLLFVNVSFHFIARWDTLDQIHCNRSCPRTRRNSSPWLLVVHGGGGGDGLATGGRNVVAMVHGVVKDREVSVWSPS